MTADSEVSGLLDLTDPLRDLQDGHDALRRLGGATDLEQFRRAFEQTLGHVRSAQYAVGRAVRTAVRDEVGRPRVRAAAQWWTSETAVAHTDPLLQWVRDARGASICEVGAGTESGPAIDERDVEPVSSGEPRHLRVAVIDPPATHLGAPLSATDRTASGLLALALSYCEALFERTRNRWG